MRTRHNRKRFINERVYMEISNQEEDREGSSIEEKIEEIGSMSSHPERKRNPNQGT